MNILSTERIVIREWQDSDLLPFALMNADSKVMKYFPARLTEQETRAMVERIQAHIQRHGFGLWAAELKATKEFIGFIGLNVPSFTAHFTPCVEIGWRLARSFWGQGLATEGGKAVLDYAFDKLHVQEIVSFTSERNKRSQRVMQKIGLSHDKKDDFHHPNLPIEHPLSWHVLYRLLQKDWQTRQSSMTNDVL
ncbi:acetyltransferase [Legionella lansingensis]|uniref:Acetyltransferase n=1 Tax=Legionella lansingensis TaxID=45067 RepID=A0A0W0W0E7_9GAMM|nr:GNAT family N-acetyltransferase [Legionella lansingensis]KTD25721.1 acetyltransferase [Legionella lansingensis]SNV49258.1 acetyltransferase [Legionella lansingensis]